MSALHHESFADLLRALDQPLVPPATLAEARQRRDALAGLLGREREAAADFLLALSDFDRRRGWERLGHASLFAFLTRELGLSNGAAYLRLTAARLLPRHPAVEAALRQGRLCLSAVGELSRVLTVENEAGVLPRFFGRSSREAREVAAAILPCPNPPRRDAVTPLRVHAPTPFGAGAVAGTASRSETPAALQLADPAAADRTVTVQGTASGPDSASIPLRAHEVAPPSSARPVPDQVRPLTADLRRLAVTVSARFLEKLSTARDGLSHALPGATTEQVLETALDLLLEKQARSKALVKRPRKGRTTAGTTTTAPASLPTTEPTTTPPGIAPALASSVERDAEGGSIPAAIEREVRLRDGDRCQFPLDAGGVCGSTWQVQLDHLVPRALGGPSTAANLRCACSFHNRYAAELELGPAVAGLRRRK